jgi:hypothetical protein
MKKPPYPEWIARVLRIPRTQVRGGVAGRMVNEIIVLSVTPPGDPGESPAAPGPALPPAAASPDVWENSEARDKMGGCASSSPGIEQAAAPDADSHIWRSA